MEGAVRHRRPARDAGEGGSRCPSEPTAAEQARLVELLLARPRAAGFATELWTLERLAQVIAQEFGVHYQNLGCLTPAAVLGQGCQHPESRACER